MADTNFEFLNAISQDQQIEITRDQQKFEKQSENLSTILNNVNAGLKETRKKRRDSDLLYQNQANQLSEKSDAITTNVVKAQADPFQGLKAFFQITPSINEWAARHNAVQNELNRVKRNYATSAAEYNFEITELQTSIAEAAQKRKLTQEGIAQAGQSAQVLSTQMLAQDRIFKQQLDTMLLPDLQAELENPDSQLPAFLVQERIMQLQSAQAKLATARQDTGKSALQLQKELADVVTEFPFLVPEETVTTALATNETQIWPQTGARITPQLAKTILPLQQKAAQERQKILVDITNNQIQSTVAMRSMAGTIQRSVGPGVSVISRDETGEPAGFNYEALPGSLQIEVAKIQESQEVIADLDFMARQSSGTEVGEQLQLTANGMRREMQAGITTVIEGLVADATTGMKNEQAKEATGQYVRDGRIVAAEGATQLLMEEMQTAVPGTMDAGVHGKGWAAGANIFATRYQEDLNDLAGRQPGLFEGELTEEKLFALALGSQARFEATLAAQSALGTERQDGSNALRFEILNDWYEVATVEGVKQVMADHVNEPETVKLLQSLMLGDTVLAPEIAQSPQGNLALFSKIVAGEAALKQKGVLPEESNLARELQSKLLSDKFYSEPTVRKLTMVQTPVAAGLSRMLFNNQPRIAFVNGMQQNISAIPLNRLPQLIQAAQQQSREIGPGRNVGINQIFNPPSAIATGAAQTAVETGLRIGGSLRSGIEQLADDFVGFMANQFIQQEQEENRGKE